MSVSLVVLRFEIADDFGLPSSAINFKSCGYNIPDMTDKENKMQEEGTPVNSQDSATDHTASPTQENGQEEEEKKEKMRPVAPSNRGQQKGPARDALAERKLMDQHRGSREMKDITIETMVFTSSHLDKKTTNLGTGKKEEPTYDKLLDPVQDGNPNARQPSQPSDQQQSNSAGGSQSSKPSGNRNKKSKKMPGKADAAAKRESKTEAVASPNPAGRDKPGGSLPGSGEPEQSIPKEEKPPAELSADPTAATTATTSYASVVSGNPIPHMVELETKDDQNVSSMDSGVLVGGGTLDGKHASKSPLSKHQSVIPFFSGNPSVEITKGILHLFKENEMTPLDEGITRSEMLCMLAVPAVMTCHDLLQMAAPLSQGIQLMRIIRDANPNQYMVLIKFKQQKDADEFYSEFNGKPFNSIESSVCYLVYVSRVECMKSSEGATLPVPGLTELPTCHICLERMDESVDGILTILCNHSFHGNCLNKWGDTSCPVCRYCQTPEAVEDHRCFTCGAQESLWICLICGHVGCGRYSNRHSYRHFEETQHTYAMQLGNQRVWDYAGDNYVHRLVQSKGDGKPIEWDRQDTETAHTEKLDSLQLEYSYLLTSQLESQRIYFEEQMARIEQDALNRMSEVETRSRKTVEERDKMEQCLQTALKEKAGLERKCAQLSGRLNKISVELKEEKEMNRCLRDNQQLWQTKVTELETKYVEDSKKKQGEIDELRDQLRDLMFYLDAQQKIGSTPEDTRQEIQDGQIVIGEAGARAGASGSSSSSFQRKGRKKGR